uniref:Uncharacterized protein n=1 Tax=Molossus molossus TaxID=27622 RepID=A0A7J8BYC4_MOLMO|nr:hypothetical protein HJG59_010015 [Molossus molossus]
MLSQTKPVPCSNPAAGLQGSAGTASQPHTLQSQSWPSLNGHTPLSVHLIGTVHFLWVVSMFPHPVLRSHLPGTRRRVAPTGVLHRPGDLCLTVHSSPPGLCPPASCLPGDCPTPPHAGGPGPCVCSGPSREWQHDVPTKRST